MKSASLGELARLTSSRLIGDPEVVIRGVGTLAKATSGEITFLANKGYRRLLKATKASVVILTDQDAEDCPVSCLVSANPHLTYAQVANHLFPRNSQAIGISIKADIDPGATVDVTANIAAGCVIAAGAVIGPDVNIGPNCIIGRNASIGSGTWLYASVILCDDVVIGCDCILYPGAVIGSDGFGFANDNGRWIKVPQLGGVRIGNNVEIGANTTVDRGAIEDTIIHDGVKLDNQIQIAHNVQIGAHTAIAACSGVSGSTKIGEYCTLAGSSGLVGHIELADHVHISGKTMVSRSITKPGVYTGSIPSMPHKVWLKNFPRLKKLDEMMRRLVRLEAIVSKSEDHSSSV